MFQVRWKRSALDEVAALWLQADVERRRAVAAAVQEINEQLRASPDVKGEVRPNNRRAHVVQRLAVLYRVDVGRSLVRILQVWAS